MTQSDLDATRAAAQALAEGARGVAQSWLRRNVWGVVALAGAALALAVLSVVWG